jgi:hypothetical protein
MATSRTVIPAAMAAADGVRSAGKARRRRIDQQAGRALVILGHAIEYLADEFLYEGATFSANRGQVEAIQILMALNREIYMACPEVPTFRQWLRSRLHREPKRMESAGELASELSHSRI